MSLESLHVVRHWFSSIAVGLLMFCSDGFAVPEYYVSPDGSNDNPGTEARPFRTLKKARDALREANANMTADVHV